MSNIITFIVQNYTRQESQPEVTVGLTHRGFITEKSCKVGSNSINLNSGDGKEQETNMKRRTRGERAGSLTAWVLIPLGDAQQPSQPMPPWSPSTNWGKQWHHMMAII